MKKTIIFAVLIILNFAVEIDASEVQLSGGFEFGLGTYKVNNDFWFSNGSNYYFCNEDTSSVFFAPGVTFGLRVFPDNSQIGFIFRDRGIFITNYTQTGKASINNSYTSVSDTYSIADGNFIVSIMDFSPGISIRYKISDRFQFYTDLGLNLTIMESEQYDNSGDTLDYLGFGIFTALAFQFNITQKIYLELGFNGIINIFSAQEGEYGNPYNPYQLIKYEDAGKFDLSITAAYLIIGWRFDLEKLRNVNLR
jgi:hypothetical protein